MIDDIETKGYGLPYLGIKPTAVGVVQLPPMPAAPMMPAINPAVNIPAPVKVPTDQNPSHVATPLPMSRPQIPTTLQPLKTTQRPMSNMQLLQNPAQEAPPAPQIDGPQYPALNKGLFSQVPMGGIQNKNILNVDPYKLIGEPVRDNIFPVGYQKGDLIPGLLPNEPNLPPSLQPQPAKLPQQPPSFNRLTSLLTRK